jgi:hypothetical protein
MSRALVTLRNARSVLLGVCLMTLVVLLVCGASAQAAFTHVYTGQSFGPEGRGGVGFSQPGGIAVDQKSGDVFVYDAEGEGSVYKFDAGGEPANFSGLGTNRITGVGSAGGSTAEVAVDSSAGSDSGDIYVANVNSVRIYSAAGGFLGELTGGVPCGVAVDPSGAVYVGLYPETVKKFTPVANPVTNADETSSMGGLVEVCNVAADSQGNVYANTVFGAVRRYDALQFGSLAATGSLVDEKGSTLAVDPSTNNVLIDERSDVAEYDPAGALLGTSKAGNHENSFGVAVKGGGDMYASEGESSPGSTGVRVGIFGPRVLVPDVSIEASSMSGATVTVRGSVDPDGVAVSSCQFEYGSEAGVFTHTVACSPDPGSGATPVSVSGSVSGLPTDTTYRYRLTATNSNGSNHSQEGSFTTPGPSVSGESFSNVGPASATVSADVNANGAPTSFRVEYGPTTAYGSSTAETSIGTGSGPVGVIAHLSGLQAETVYHFRFVASNGAAVAEGEDVAFSTLSTGVLGLPDDRGYEMVTPATSEGKQAYTPFGSGSLNETLDGIETSYPFRAAADGNAVAYVGEPTAEGNGNEIREGGNEFLATRGSEGGWTQRDIQPNGVQNPKYASFSNDLSASVLMSDAPLAAGVPSGYEYLYARDSVSGSLSPLFTVKPYNRPTQDQFGASASNGEILEKSIGYFFAGASEDYKHLFFEANDALTANAVDGGEQENNLYESVEGMLRLVNVLPDGSTQPNASFGAPPTERYEAENADHAIAADGSRVFWTDLNTGSLYVRENDSTTVLVSEDATFWTASANGSRVLYSREGNLYEDDLSSGETTDLAPGGQVLGLAGSSENAEYVYFAAEGSLAPGATAGQPNLYLHHGSTTTFIATLAYTDGENVANHFYGGSGGYGDWRPGLAHRTAESSADGQALTFMSVKSLTGFDNRDSENESVDEVYVYEVQTGGLSCASCSPSGERPVRSSEYAEATGIPAGYLSVTDGFWNSYQLRSISEDGGRVVFQSTTPLVAQDVNGRTDVYEWERDGTGSCHSSNGCVYILSDGASPGASYFIDASADGSNVFFVTKAQLVAADQNEDYDVYDARIGVESPPTPPQCTGSGCQGVPEAPPIFATPSSATFNGVGNFTAPAKPTTKSKPKAKTKTKHKQKPHKKKQKRGKQKPKSHDRAAEKAKARRLAKSERGR